MSTCAFLHHFGNCCLHLQYNVIVSACIYKISACLFVLHSLFLLHSFQSKSLFCKIIIKYEMGYLKLRPGYLFSCFGKFVSQRFQLNNGDRNSVLKHYFQFYLFYYYFYEFKTEKILKN